MSDFQDITEIHASAQLSEILRPSLSPNSQSAPISSLIVEILSSIQDSGIWFVQNTDRKESRSLREWMENLHLLKQTYNNICPLATSDSGIKRHRYAVFGSGELAFSNNLHDLCEYSEGFAFSLLHP